MIDKPPTKTTMKPGLVHRIGVSCVVVAVEKVKILVVEDDAGLAALSELILRREGYQVSVAANLVEARSELALRQFQFVLIDICLPDGSGLDLLPSLENLESPKFPKFIISSGNTSDSLSLDHRITGVFSKPYRMDLLLRFLKSQFNLEAEAQQ